jgi:hypothetical protein
MAMDKATNPLLRREVLPLFADESHSTLCGSAETAERSDREFQ